MYCKHCGQETSDEEVFCWYCGKRVNPTSVVFNRAHKEVINAYTVQIYSKSGFYLIGNLGFGFVILNDNNKKLVVDTLFEDIITEGRGYVDSILVKKNGKWGLINPFTGEILCDFIYDDISQIGEDCEKENGEIIVYSNGLCGKIDCNGNIILPIIYDEIGSYGRVKKQGLWGLLKNGEQIIPCEYNILGGNDILDDFWQWKPSQYKNGKWGVINGNDGEIILEFEYDEIKFIEEDYYYVMRKGDKWGSKMGKFRFPCEFSLKEIKQATTAYLEDYQWTLYAENGRKLYLAADEIYVSCYTQEGNNQPQKIIFGFAYLGEGYEIDYQIMYSQRYGNNIFLVGEDTLSDPKSIGWTARFYIYKINAENFDWDPIGGFAAIHFEKDGFKVANGNGTTYDVFNIHDSYYDVNGEMVMDDKYNGYGFEDMVCYYGESLVNAQKMVARGLLNQV